MRSDEAGIVAPAYVVFGAAVLGVASTGWAGND
jgi:hypothetical protein